jgi:FlaA1/EpsC-like NDP-sugar epimerase
MINNTTEHILALPRPVKRLLALSVDALLFALTVWLALCLRLESWVVLTDEQWLAVGLSLALALPVFVASGLYRAIFRYAGLAASIAVIKAMLIYGGLYAAVLAALDLPGVPRTLGMLQPLLLLLAVGASRALARFWLSGAYLSKIQRGALPKVLIYGAGSAGYQLAGAMANNNDMRVVGFWILCGTLRDLATGSSSRLKGLSYYGV